MKGLWTKWVAAGALCAMALFGYARLDEPGFEGSVALGEWVGPWGFGAVGGEGSGSFVDSGEHDFVRTGNHALRLTVRDNGNPEAVAWAGVSQTKLCEPRSRVRAGAWIYCSGDHSPPTEGRAIAQLRLEYFRDETAEQIIPTHVTLSTPFTSSTGHAPDTWHLVQVYDRVPSQARALKFSILLLSQRPDNKGKVVWIDDAFLEFQDQHGAGSYTDFEGRAY